MTVGMGGFSGATADGSSAAMSESTPLPVRQEPVIGASLESSRPPFYAQGLFISVLGAAFVLALAILAVRDDANVTGIPATETTGPLFWGLAVLFTAIIAFGSQYSEIATGNAAAALGHVRPVRELHSAWIVPLAGMAAAILLVATLHNTYMFIGGPLLAFLAIGGSLLARDLLDDATLATFRTASIVHMVVILIVAFFYFSAVYLNKMNLLAAVPLVAIGAALLTLETLERGRPTVPQRTIYALVAAFILAEVMVALNWWLTYGWTGGGLLVVCFFVVSGALLAHTQPEGIRPRSTAMYGIVAIIALVIIIITA